MLVGIERRQGGQEEGIRGHCGLAAGRGARWADACDAHGDGMIDGNDGMMGSDGRWRWLWVMAGWWGQVPGLA